MHEEHFEKTERAVWGGIALHAALACLNGVVGVLSQSKAMVADAAHSASDAMNAVAALFRLRTAKISPDEAFPRGQGKRISFASNLFSVIILVAGVEMGISAIKSIWVGADHAPKGFALAAIGISLFVKEVMFQYTYRLGKRLGSKELIANSWGHRSNIYSSIVALVGIFGAMMGKYLGVPFLYYLDPLAGLFVSLMVLRMGFTCAKAALHTNTYFDIPHNEDAAELITAVQLIKGVITVDDLRVREQGHYVVVDIKISVNPRMSVWEGHEVSKKIKQQLMKRFHHIADVFVHVTPYDAGYPYKNNMDTEMSEFPSVIH